MSLCIPPNIFLWAPSDQGLILLEHCSRGRGKDFVPQKYPERSWHQVCGWGGFEYRARAWKKQRLWIRFGDLFFSPTKSFDWSCKIKISNLLGLEIQSGNWSIKKNGGGVGWETGHHFPSRREEGMFSKVTPRSRQKWKIKRKKIPLALQSHSPSTAWP